MINKLKKIVVFLIRKTFGVLGLKIERIKDEETLISQLRFFPYFIDKEIEGVKFHFFVGDTDGRLWYHTKATDPFWPEMKFVKDKIVQKGDLVYECGAHHGCTTILLSDWVGETGKVIAFEPNPSNYEIAKINISINNIKNVELIKGAVGTKAGMIMMDISESNSSVVSEQESAKGIYMVKSLNLDSFDERIPDVLKIDVEGFEREVLVGAQRILRATPKLAIEIHADQLGRYNTTVSELFDLLNKDNYDFWIQWEDNQPPIPYNFEKPINKRVHLFGLPKVKPDNL
jgi:FkbM family methyltransferase